MVQLIDTKYYELTGIPKQIVDDLIRPERSCRLGLRRWGTTFETNSQRPYFEGYKRDDVVKHRNEFINYFLAYKDFYYTFLLYLLIGHDQKTFFLMRFILVRDVC